MPYATETDLKQRFKEASLIELTDTTGSGEIDSTVVGKALQDASDFLDATAGGALETPNSAAINAVCNVAYYYLHDGAIPEDVRNRYRDAERLFQRAAAGKADLGPRAGTDSAVLAGGVDYDAPDRVFDADSLASY